MKNTKTANCNKQSSTFYQSKLDILIAKYHLHCIIAVFIFGLYLEVFGILKPGNENVKISFPDGSLFIVLPLLATVAILFRLITSKFAYKIKVNNEKNKIWFFLHHKKENIECRLDEIDCIYINWFICFRLAGGGKIYYRGDIDFFDYIINNDFNLVWGYWGKKLSADSYKKFRLQEKELKKKSYEYIL